MVDAHLATDRAVHLRQQRRWHVHERDATQISRSREPGHVADDAAAEGDDRRAAISRDLDERVVDARHRAELFEPFAVRDENGLYASGASRHARAVEPPDSRARDDEAAFGDLERVEQPPHAIQ